MKKSLVLAMAIFASSTSFGLSKDALGECAINDTSTQYIFGLLGDEARAGQISKADYQKMLDEIMSEKVKTCRQATGLAAEQLSIVYKK